MPNFPRRNANETPEGRLATSIIDMAREFARSVPPARGAPFFYVDSGDGYDPQVLGMLSERGIFRKYEFALDVGCGLGGRARWLAARSGCRVLGVDSRPAVIAAAAILNRRARMDDQVRFQVGDLGCLPLRSAIFTHVWLIDLPSDAATASGYAEAFRVLRPGGHFAMQCHVASLDAATMFLASLRHAGFIDLDARTDTFPDLPHTYRLARQRLQITLRDKPDERAIWERLQHHVPEAVRLLLFARRPA